MLGDERVGVCRRTFQGREIALTAYIPEGHADISQEPAPLDSLDGGAAKKLAEPGVIERQTIA